MLFNSLAYLIFLPLVCVVYYLLPHKLRWVALLGFSYYFYMSWNPELLVLILFTTLVSWGSALCIGRSSDPRLRRAVLYLGCGACLAVLFFFKYFDFFSTSVHSFFAWFGLSVSTPVLNLILPVGISFYTFQTLSYVIDVYRGTLPAETHFGYYALYVSFFPQLVAGPIERADRLLPQFRERHSFDTARCSSGLRRILVGMFKKVVIADYLSTFVNNVYNNLSGLGGWTLIGATFLFSIQIYCDFSGYSEIAVGSAELLGFRLMDNFNSPYMARSIKEFWRRWHISLSGWFTDYVYIPLGGSRCTRPIHWRNLLVTFLCSGLWHGANWTFILWGLYHGLLLCAETLYLPRLERLQQRHSGTLAGALLSTARTLVTFAAVVFGWIFFRANNLRDLLYIFSGLFRGINPLRLVEYMSYAGMEPVALLVAALLIGLLLGYDWYASYRRPPLQAIRQTRPLVRYLFYYALCIGILIALFLRPVGAQADFIYFQF